jgi:Protein of unknown function (DUF3313)
MKARYNVVRLLGLLVLLADASVMHFIPSVAVAADKPPQEWDGLVRREGKLANVYVRPNVEFKAYKNVRLDPVRVEFDKNWDPNRNSVNRLSSTDTQQIRDQMAKAFREVFAERLAKDGYALVDGDADDVLLVQAALINVYINAPDTRSSGRSHTYVMDAGRMTVVMQLADSVTGQLLARVVDTKQGTSYARLQWSSSVSNSVEARKIFTEWADALCRALDKLNGRAS